MRYDHIVNHNGVYYQAGEDVPDKQIDAGKKSEGKSESSLPFEPMKYKKTDINRMSKTELQNLASEIGIDGAFEESGENLKKKIIDYFGL